MSLIPDRVWAQMTPDEQEKVQAAVYGWRHEPRVTCPSCGTHLAVRAQVKLGSVRLETEPDAKPGRSKAAFAVSDWILGLRARARTRQYSPQLAWPGACHCACLR